MRMLIVEDEFTSRKILGRFLARYGEVDVAVDGEEALSALEDARDQETPYDVVFLDVMMPGLSGHDVLAKVRENERERDVPAGHQLKVVMTTAADGKADVLSAFRAQVEAYLTKPLDRAKVDQALTKLGYQPVA
jgi:two-component system chemotaxis response regulator CheY